MAAGDTGSCSEKKQLRMVALPVDHMVGGVCRPPDRAEAHQMQGARVDRCACGGNLPRTAQTGALSATTSSCLPCLSPVLSLAVRTPACLCLACARPPAAKGSCNVNRGACLTASRASRIKVESNRRLERPLVLVLALEQPCILRGRLRPAHLPPACTRPATTTGLKQCPTDARLRPT